MYCISWSNANKTYWYAEDLRQERLLEQEILLNKTGFLTPDEEAELQKLQEEIDLLEETQANTLYARDCLWYLNVFHPMAKDTCGKHL